MDSYHQYDLLNPIQIKPPVAPLSAQDHHKANTKSIKLGLAKVGDKQKMVHEELFCLFAENPECFNFSAHMTSTPCVIAAIRK